jgi:hypothetical protein
MNRDEPDELARVNVEDGFLPTFAVQFTDHYGSNSCFVRAASDYFTLALARLLQANNRLQSERIASFAPLEATEALRELMNSLTAVRDRRAVGQELMQEAYAKKALGSFASLVDSVHGKGCFERWRNALEAERYEDAKQEIPNHGAG